MRSFIPTMSLAPEPARKLRSKFGGLPAGLPGERWPACRECGLPMSSLAQIPVRGHLDRAAPFSERPDLADRVLHVFTCERPSICSFWDHELGANAAFFVAKDELVAASAPPQAMEAPTMTEVLVDGWTAHDDEVTPAMAESFCDHAAFYALPEVIQFPHDFELALSTKLGGVPYWTGNGPTQAPAPPFRYLLQIDKFLMAEGGDDEGYVDLGNFCSDGTGYVFVDMDTLDAKFLINR